MEKDVVFDDAEYGFTWCHVEGRYLLQKEDGGFREVNEAVIHLLTKLARGEITVPELQTQVEGGKAVIDESNTTAEEVISLVEEYVEQGILREDEPVTEITPPDDVALWPYVSAFLISFSVFGAAVVSIVSNVSATVIEKTTIWQLASVMVLSITYVGIHEYGHYAVSARHFDPSVRFDFVNGVVPAAVTDTTGSWMLPRNWRILINLAGPLLELVAGIPVLVLHFVFPQNVLVQLLLVSLFAHVLLSLNPLIHGDGFWIMCDLFDLVNVRRQGIDDLANLRLSWNAMYVILSYGFGAFFTLYMIVMLLKFLGIADVPLPH